MPSEIKRVLITVRTYPVPATKGIEVSCTAAITPDGKWIRLFPVPYRFLTPDKRFKKWQWVDVSVIRASSDVRPESHRLDIASLKIVSELPPGKNWAARRTILKPLMARSLCDLERNRKKNGSPTLGVFRPKKIKRLTIKAVSADWNAKQANALAQQMLGFEKGPAKKLEKIPFEFRYRFRCDDSACKGHTLLCTDWEMAEAYRAWKAKYGKDWEAKFRERFERDMIEKFDTHLFVGTVHLHPSKWLVVGLFYPPKSAQKELF